MVTFGLNEIIILFQSLGDCLMRGAGRVTGAWWFHSKSDYFFLRGTCWFRGFFLDIQRLCEKPQVCLFFNGASWLLTVKFRPRFSVFTGQKSQLQQPMLRFPAYLTTIIASSIHISLAVLAWFPPHGWLRFGNLALFAGHEMRAWSVTKQLENRLMKAHQCCFWKHLFDWYCGFSFINVVLWLLTFLHDHWVQCSALPIFAYAGVLFFFWKAYTYLGSGSFLPKGCKGSSLYCNSFWGAE